jgi:hypothetical protein
VCAVAAVERGGVGEYLARRQVDRRDDFAVMLGDERVV